MSFPLPEKRPIMKILNFRLKFNNFSDVIELGCQCQIKSKTLVVPALQLRTSEIKKGQFVVASSGKPPSVSAVVHTILLYDVAKTLMLEEQTTLLIIHMSAFSDRSDRDHRLHTIVAGGELNFLFCLVSHYHHLELSYRIRLPVSN